MIRFAAAFTFFALHAVQGQLIPTIPSTGNSSPPSCQPTETLVSIEITLDATPTENQLFIEDDCTGVGESFSFPALSAFQTVDYSFCSETAIFDIAKLRLRITDSGGNGLSPAPAGYRFQVGSTVYTGTNFGSEAIHYFGGLQLCDVVGQVTGFLECFAGSSTTVHSEAKGVIPMEQLEVGDKVLTSNGKYEPVYTIDHRNTNTRARFIQIFTDKEQPSLEVTPKHMVFVYGKSEPVAAASLKMGVDQLITLHGPQLITKLQNIVRNDGVYNPITTDGTIVVNDAGIVASSFSAHLPGKDEIIEVSNIHLLSHQQFFNMAMRPLNKLCTGVSMEFCKLSSTEGKIAVSRVAADVFKFWSNIQNETLQAILVGVAMVFVFVLSVFHYGVLVCGGVVLLRSISKRKV